MWTLRQIDGFDSEDAHPRSDNAADSWQPWRIGLRDAAGLPAAGDGTRLTFCSYGKGALYCAQQGIAAARIDPRRGRLLWSTHRTGRPAPTDDAPGTDPAAAPATDPYAATDATDATGVTDVGDTGNANDANDGTTSGTGTEGERGDETAGVPSAPVFAGGLVQTLSPDGKRLTARDPRTRKQRWTRDVSAYAGRVYRAGDSVLLVSADSTVTAIDAASNERRWSHPLTGHALPTFVAYGTGEVAYALTTAPDGSNTQVSAVDPTTGDVRWTHRLRGTLMPVGADRDGVVRFTATDLEQRATAVVRYDPARREERRVKLAAPLPTSSVAVSDEVVYLHGYDGGLVAVDTSAGAARPRPWRLETSVSNASPLVAAGDRLYFSAADGRLIAVDAVAGRLLGQTPPRPGRATTGFVDHVPAPVAAEGKVFAAAPDGTLFAVDDRVPSRW